MRNPDERRSASLRAIDRALQRWRDAALIDAETAARILAYEEANAAPTRPYGFYALGGLGALSIAIGLLAIVASNWDAIPAQVKLLCDLALLVGLAAGTAVAARRAESSSGGLSVAAWVLDVLVFVYAGATLASIALVGQIYHLGGQPRHALAYFAAITAPLILLGRGRLLMASWVVLVQGTALANLDALFDDWTKSSRQHEVLMSCTALCMSLAMMLLGQLGALKRRRPQLASVVTGLGAMQWLVMANLATGLWYSHSDRYASLAPLLGAGLAVSLLFAAPLALRGGAALGAFLVYGTLGCFLPALIPHDNLKLVGALSFLGLWALGGFYGLRGGALWFFNLATAVIGLRLLVVYFEVFGSLLYTGQGLIGGGLLTLFLAWLWLRRVRRSAKIAAPAPPPPADGGPR